MCLKYPPAQIAFQEILQRELHENFSFFEYVQRDRILGYISRERKCITILD
jgi:hypothetical protein